MSGRIALPVLIVLLLVSCGRELSVEAYADLLAERLDAASRGEDPDSVLPKYGVEYEEYARFELEVFSSPNLAGEVLDILRLDHPELLPPEMDPVTAAVRDGDEPESISQ